MSEIVWIIINYWKDWISDKNLNKILIKVMPMAQKNSCISNFCHIGDVEKINGEILIMYSSIKQGQWICVSIEEDTDVILFSYRCIERHAMEQPIRLTIIHLFINLYIDWKRIYIALAIREEKPHFLI